MSRVVILQEYIPGYRVAFFEKLHSLCAAEDIELIVASGRPNSDQGRRGDVASVAFATTIRQQELSILGRRVVIRQIRKIMRGADLVIMEQARRNVDVYRLLLPKRLGVTKIALWGHGKDYTRPTKALDRSIQRVLTARATWFFSYTLGGLDAVVSQGYNRARITVVQNSIDTAALRASIGQITAPSVDEFAQLHDLRGQTAFFLGALDESKRLPFLLEAAIACHDANSEFRLLLGGNGPLREWVIELASTYSWLTYLGAVSGQDKALALAASQVLAMPGRVGLVAVDSFSAGIPIVTTDWPWHAPEFEYLEDGINGVIAIDSVSAYSQALGRTLGDKDLLNTLGNGCRRSSEDITVTKMAQNFLGGIRSALVGGAV